MVPRVTIFVSPSMRARVFTNYLKSTGAVTPRIMKRRLHELLSIEEVRRTILYPITEPLTKKQKTYNRDSPVKVKKSLRELMSEIGDDLYNLEDPAHFSSLEQDSEDWHTLRNTVLKVTGSEFAAAMGLSTFSSRQELYEKKVNNKQKPSSAFQEACQQHGKDHEDEVFEIIRQLLPNELRLEKTGTHVFVDSPDVGSTPDGLFKHSSTGEVMGVLEIKCPYYNNCAKYSCLEEKPASCKLEHYIQMQMEMRVTDTQYAMYAVYSHPYELYLGTLLYNEDDSDMIWKDVIRFKERCIEKKEKPLRFAKGEKLQLQNRFVGNRLLDLRVVDVATRNETVLY
jgi:putative phage-type endonuclease